MTKVIGTNFPGGGIADRMIAFNGFPFLDTKEEHDFHVPVSSTMTPASRLAMLPVTGLTLRNLEQLLTASPFRGFPIVSSIEPQSRTLLGYLGRTELLYAINKARAAGPISPNATCSFAPSDPIVGEAGYSASSRRPMPLRTASSAAPPPVTFDEIASQRIDFGRFVDPTPLTVHPRLELETVMELFKKMGPRVVLVELKGRLAGLVTVKDCLKYQFRGEAAVRMHALPGGDVLHAVGGTNEADARLWRGMTGVGAWVGGLVNRASRGHIRLGSDGAEGLGLMGVGSTDQRDSMRGFGVADREREDGILDGTEEVELEERER